ncbi:hypothetical protein V1523DRAFT_419569 [Lipomyces doorenjongii]
MCHWPSKYAWASTWSLSFRDFRLPGTNVLQSFSSLPISDSGTTGVSFFTVRRCNAQYTISITFFVLVVVADWHCSFPQIISSFFLCHSALPVFIFWLIVLFGFYIASLFATSCQQFLWFHITLRVDAWNC